MTDETAARNRDAVARLWLAVLTLSLVLLVGAWFLTSKIHKVRQLSAVWSGEQIHVRSAKDGPWLVTHIVAYDSGGSWRAIAQLPSPVTIIDSRGHYFTPNEIDGLEWVDAQGNAQRPPATGDRIGVMYIVPSESKR